MTSRDYAWLVPASAVSLAAGVLLGRAADGWAVFAVMLALAAGACWLLRWPGRMLAVQAMVLALGCLAGYGAYHPSLPPEGSYTVSGVVAEELRLREDGQVRTLLRGVTLDGQPLVAGAYWSFYLDEGGALPEGLAPGCRVSLQARVYHPGGADNPGGYDFREYLLQKGCTIGVYGDEIASITGSWHPLGLAARLRHHLAQRLCTVMGDTAGGYAATMLLGSQSLIPQEDREAFSRLGIAHILSVSGFHVGVLAGMLRWVLMRLKVSRKGRLACTALVLAAYCLLTGLNAPVLRAAMLYLLYELGAVLHRQRSPLHLLCATFVVLLVLSPAQLTSLSFQLTYGAMLGLTLVSPWLESLHTPRRFARVWRSLCAALSAQAGILLPELYWFQELPLMGIGLNMLVISLGTVLIGLCWVVLFLLPVPQVSGLLGRATAWLMDGLLAGVRAMGDWPGVTLWTCRASILTAAACALLIYCLSWWWRGRHRGPAVAAAVVALALSVFPFTDTGSRYVQLSVGEADAALLQDGGRSIAIDTGEDGQALVSYLHQRRISLDALVLTHLHTDHAGGIAALADSGIPIGVCYVPYGAREALVDEKVLAALDTLEAAGTQVITLSRGDVLALPNGSITVLWPENGRVRPGQEANDSSLVLLAEVKGSTLLLTGDLSGRYEMYAAGHADVLKLAHHGSATSTGDAFLREVSPQLLLLSCGTEERSQAVEARQWGLPVADTHRDGCITLHFDNGGFTVETMR